METRNRRRLVPLATICLAAILASCASDYERDFRREATRMPGIARGPEGAWKGEWRSEVNGHHGPLWCMIGESEDGAGFHDFRYRAGWGVLKFGDYTHRPATRRGKDGSLAFEGAMDLPGDAGRFDVEGRVTAERFDARFRSERGDRGTMVLTRP